MSESTLELIDKGIQCLSDHLGPDETERFITVILRERFDYTKWHQRFADEVGRDDFQKLVSVAERVSPFHSKAGIVI